MRKEYFFTLKSYAKSDAWEKMDGYLITKEIILNKDQLRTFEYPIFITKHANKKWDIICGISGRSYLGHFTCKSLKEAILDVDNIMVNPWEIINAIVETGISPNYTKIRTKKKGGEG